jgi:hypothetical protein
MRHAKVNDLVNSVIEINRVYPKEWHACTFKHASTMPLIQKDQKKRALSHAMQ